MAAQLFKITPAIRRLAENAIDTMIDQLGKDCMLIFDGKQGPCPNCYFDNSTGRSSGHYNGTGPRPFTRPPCPVCRGTGFDPQPQNTSAVVRFLVEWNPKPWQYIQPGVVIPQGLVQTKGWIEDMPKIIQCKSIIIDYQNAIYETNQFIKWSEPIPQGNIVPSRYFITLWQRAGG